MPIAHPDHLYCTGPIIKPGTHAVVSIFLGESVLWASEFIVPMPATKASSEKSSGNLCSLPPGIYCSSSSCWTEGTTKYCIVMNVAIQYLIDNCNAVVTIDNNYFALAK